MDVLVNLENWIRKQGRQMRTFQSDLNYDCKTLARADEGDIILGMLRQTGSEACLVRDDESGLANVGRVFSHVWIDVALYYYCLHILEIKDTGARYGTAEILPYNEAVKVLSNKIKSEREAFKGEGEPPYSAIKWKVPRVFYQFLNENKHLEDYDY